MKRLIMFMITLMLLFFSCATTTAIIEEQLKLPIEEVFVEPEFGFALYYGNYDYIQSMEEIPNYIMNNFIFVPGESWEAPAQITKNGCVNFNTYTILLMNIAKVRFNIDLNLAIIDVSDLLSMGITNHPLVEYNNFILNVFDLNYAIFNRPPKKIYLFNEVFNINHINPRMIL